MGQNLKCFFGLHQYEIHEQYEVTNVKGEVIGHKIVSRCKHCGKIIVDNIDLK